MTFTTQEELEGLSPAAKRELMFCFQQALVIQAGINRIEANDNRFTHIVRSAARQRIRAGHLAIIELAEALEMDVIIPDELYEVDNG